jgi:hypothetical protein
MMSVEWDLWMDFPLFSSGFYRWIATIDEANSIHYRLPEDRSVHRIQSKNTLKQAIGCR